jgi:hypothetical protein
MFNMSASASAAPEDSKRNKNTNVRLGSVVSEFRKLSFVAGAVFGVVRQKDFIPRR